MPIMDVNWFNTVDKAVTCNWKRGWTFICSHGKVMRNINESHFGPDSNRKINVTYHNAKWKKSKGSIKGKFFFCGTNYK